MGFTFRRAPQAVFEKTPRAGEIASRQDADAVTSAVKRDGRHVRPSCKVKVLDHHGYFKAGALAGVSGSGCLQPKTKAGVG